MGISKARREIIGVQLQGLPKVLLALCPIPIMVEGDPAEGRMSVPKAAVERECFLCRGASTLAGFPRRPVGRDRKATEDVGETCQRKSEPGIALYRLLEHFDRIPRLRKTHVEPALQVILIGTWIAAVAARIRLSA